MNEIAILKKHIYHYSKTREIYIAYKKSKNQIDFMKKHREEIEIHLAAKKAFNALNTERVPKIAELQKEYLSVLNDKKAIYQDYKNLRKEMLDYKTAKQNIERFLQIEQKQIREEKSKEEQR
jgi:hypothetical protein